MAGASPILLITGDEGLGADVMRLAALAGAEIQAERTSGAVRGGWRSAPIVVVGLDVVVATAQMGLSRRPGVVVAGVRQPEIDEWRAALELGATAVIEIGRDDQRLVELIANSRSPAADALIIGVVGGCGGAGASTLAVALAVTAAESAAAAVVDGDRYGGGLDVVLGAERRPGPRWADLLDTRGRIDPRALRAALLTASGVAVLPHGRGESRPVPAPVAATVLAAFRTTYATVVIDLPRRFDESSEVLVGAAHLLVLVVPATVRAVAAASTVLPALACHGVPLRLVVRDPGGDRLQASEVSGGLGLPQIAVIKSESTVVAAAMRGEPPGRRRGSLSAAARAVLSAADPSGAA
jgi:secretion/DNA translocation related CpaE-like protein